MSKTVSLVYPFNFDATIATSGTTSAEIDLTDKVLVGLYIPSTFDGTTISFTAAPTAGGTHVAVQADNTASTAYTVTTTASRYVPINPSVFAGLRFIKIVCGSSQTTTPTIITAVARSIV